MKRIDVRKSKRKPPFDPKVFLDTENSGRTISKYRKHQTLFSQGSPADAVFYIRKGKVKISVVSEQGKEAVVAIQGPDEFCGEGCLTGQARRLATAAAITECEIMRLEKSAMIRVLHDEPAFSEMFVAHLLTRTIRVEEDLVDQLFNSSEKRLARALLLLANFGKDGRPEPVIAKVSQETLAEMIGTTRSRVSHFMNQKFGLHRLQRRHRSPQFIVECRSARPTANQGLRAKYGSGTMSTEPTGDCRCLTTVLGCGKTATQVRAWVEHRRGPGETAQRSCGDFEWPARHDGVDQP